MKFARTLFTLIAVSLLPACTLPMKPSQDVGPTPLVRASCPELVPLSDDTMGALLSKLVEVANQYRECRAAALAQKPATPVE